MMTRSLDMLASTLALIVLAPVFALVAISVKLKQSGPILFRQERMGRDMKPFTLYKFRTMVIGAARMGPSVTGPDDARVTAWGRLLRRFKLDELPQLVNVLRGDMSLVGSRPEVSAYARLFPEKFSRILTRRPGLVDPATLHYSNEAAQLAAGEDPEREYLEVILPHKLAVSEAYAERRTLWTDLGFLAATIPIIFLGDVLVLGIWRQIRRELRYVLGLGRFDLLKLALDMIALSAAGVGAWMLTFPGTPEIGLRLLPGWLLVQGASLFILRVPVQFWKFFGFSDLRRLALAVGLGALACAPFTLIALGAAGGVRVLVVDGLLALAALVALRAARRARYEAEIPKHATPILVAGSSDRVEPLIREMLRSRTIGLRPLAVFCPGEVESVRNLCHDVPVFSDYGELSESTCFSRIEEIHVVGDPADLPQGTDLLLAAKHRNLCVRTVPPVWASRDWRARRASDADSHGVLTRQPIVTDLSRLGAVYQGKTVLVTGGAGSIGSQIVRSLAEAGAARIAALDLSENGLCYLAEEIRSTHPEVVFHAEVGNILDARRLEEVMFEEKPDFVFHAAARKHVNFMETAVDEAVRFNVEGTYRVAQAARAAGAKTCILISTDKAVDPTSVMGATKLLAERVLHFTAAEGSTRFASVRFGNVLGSEGSILPILRRQIARGGPVTITHPDVERFFITVREASELVLQAGGMATGGEIFILEMGEPVRIAELARHVAAVYGMDLDELGVTITGLKPGEKLTEQLWNRDEAPVSSSVSGIAMARARADGGLLDADALADLFRHAERGDAAGTLGRLVALLPEYTPSLYAIKAAAERERRFKERGASWVVEPEARERTAA